MDLLTYLTFFNNAFFLLANYRNTTLNSQCFSNRPGCTYIYTEYFITPRKCSVLPACGERTFMRSSQIIFGLWKTICHTYRYTSAEVSIISVEVESPTHFANIVIGHAEMSAQEYLYYDGLLIVPTTECEYLKITDFDIHDSHGVLTYERFLNLAAYPRIEFDLASYIEKRTLSASVAKFLTMHMTLDNFECNSCNITVFSPYCSKYTFRIALREARFAVNTLNSTIKISRRAFFVNNKKKHIVSNLNISVYGEKISFLYMDYGGNFHSDHYDLKPESVFYGQFSVIKSESVCGYAKLHHRDHFYNRTHFSRLGRIYRKLENNRVVLENYNDYLAVGIFLPSFGAAMVHALNALFHYFWIIFLDISDLVLLSIYSILESISEYIFYCFLILLYCNVYGDTYTIVIISTTFVCVVSYVVRYFHI
nr:MAG: hypothetical protein [Martellivirales sp.]